MYEVPPQQMRRTLLTRGQSSTSGTRAQSLVLRGRHPLSDHS
jgi:hypothetical protein